MNFLITLTLITFLTYTSASTTAGIGLWDSQIDPERLSQTNNSVSYEANTNYVPCTCDLTSDTCNGYCCCDSDCSQESRDIWTEQKACLNHEYAQPNGKSLADCVTRLELYNYNHEKGLENYIDPFAQLFCVKFNNAPNMAYYYLDLEELTSQDIANLLNDENKQGFGGSIFGPEQTSSDFSQSYYSLGDKMRSQLLLDPNDSPISQYQNSWPIPKPDTYGNCNNYYSAEFMENTESQCDQYFEVEQQCESVVNPIYFTDALSVFDGNHTNSDKIQVTTTELYSIENNEHIQLTDIATSLVASTMTKTDDTCECTGMLSEIIYTVTVEEQQTTNGKAYFSIVSVSAAAVLSDKTISVTCGEYASIEQKYSVNFVSSTEQIQHKSGNPGYIDGLPVLIGQQNSVTTGATNVYQHGFEIKGGDQYGQCIQTTPTNTNNIDIGNPIVQFGVNMNYGCSIDMTLSELTSFCSASSNIQDYYIFNNLQFFEKFGQFGNANIYNQNDWKSIITEDSFSSLGSATFDSATQTCSLFSNVHYHVIWADMGFSDNPQKYIVEIKKSAIEEDWVFNRQSQSVKQNFQLKVSFQFSQITNESDMANDFVAPTGLTIPSDFFYAFQLW